MGHAGEEEEEEKVHQAEHIESKKRKREEFEAGSVHSEVHHLEQPVIELKHEAPAV